MARTNAKFRIVKKETRDARLGILPYLMVNSVYDIRRVHFARKFRNAYLYILIISFLLFTSSK